MTDKEKFRAEIKRIENETNYEPFTDEVLGKRKVCQHLKNFIDHMQENPASEDLDFQTFAKEMDNVFNLPSDVTENTEEEPLNWEYAIARHFANWQKRQDMKCGYITALQGEKRFANHILEMIEKGWHIEAVKTACKDKIKEDKL